MKILSGGFWIMFVIYALIVDRALTYLPKIPYLSPYTAYASGGQSQGPAVSFNFGTLQQGGGVLVVAAILAWFTPKVF